MTTSLIEHTHETLALPGSDEVLGKVNADWSASDGDVSVTCSIQLTANLDLSPRHLPDLIDLGALTADDGAYQLGERQGGIR